MLLWVCFALMTAAVMAALLRPLWRPNATAVAPAEADIAVYRDQLNEIEADRERGLIADGEAEGAKTEVARRMLDRAGAVAQEAPVAAPTFSVAQRISTVAALLVPIASVALYLWIGSPQTPDAPLAARQNVPLEQASIEELIGKVEARLAAKPDDAQGWAVIAPIYVRTGRFADAANAYARVLTLQGESVQRLSGFAEATVMANNGVVTDTARKAFKRILELDPQRTEAAFGLALAKEQDGDLAAALADYRQMLAAAPPDANWQPALEERIKALEGRMTGKPLPAAPQAAAPSANAAQRTSPEDLAKMSPADREKFITSMVEGLASRLKTDGKDLPGWLRLIRAYAVLGRDEDATTATAEARRNFDGDAKALGEIDALAKSLKQGS